jgi:hypothetical protein
MILRADKESWSSSGTLKGVSKAFGDCIYGEIREDSYNMPTRQAAPRTEHHRHLPEPGTASTTTFSTLQSQSSPLGTTKTQSVIPPSMFSLSRANCSPVTRQALHAFPCLRQSLTKLTRDP